MNSISLFNSMIIRNIYVSLNKVKISERGCVLCTYDCIIIRFNATKFVTIYIRGGYVLVSVHSYTETLKNEEFVPIESVKLTSEHVIEIHSQLMFKNIYNIVLTKLVAIGALSSLVFIDGIPPQVSRNEEHIIIYTPNTFVCYGMPLLNRCVMFHKNIAIPFCIDGMYALYSYQDGCVFKDIKFENYKNVGLCYPKEKPLIFAKMWVSFKYMMTMVTMSKCDGYDLTYYELCNKKVFINEPKCSDFVEVSIFVNREMLSTLWSNCSGNYASSYLCTGCKRRVMYIGNEFFENGVENDCRFIGSRINLSDLEMYAKAKYTGLKYAMLQEFHLYTPTFNNFNRIKLFYIKGSVSHACVEGTGSTRPGNIRDHNYFYMPVDHTFPPFQASY